MWGCILLQGRRGRRFERRLGSCEEERKQRRGRKELRGGWMKGRRLGYRKKRNLLVYRNLLRVNFLDLKKSSNVFIIFLRREVLGFKKKKRNPIIFCSGAFCKSYS